MEKIEFYEKPGCINGEKQKKILTEAGNKLICIDILKFPWTKSALLPFVEGKEPEEMMNSTAPAIKSGEIVPSRLSMGEAIKMMVACPILIKRPLILAGGMHIQGFDNPRLKPYIGSWSGTEDVITCPNLQTISCDETQ